MEPIPLVKFGLDLEQDIVVVWFVPEFYMKRDKFLLFLEKFGAALKEDGKVFASACDAMRENWEQEQEARQKVETAQVIEEAQKLLGG